MAANEPDSQNNCPMCPAFSRTTAFSLSREWSINLSMISWSRFS